MFLFIFQSDIEGFLYYRTKVHVSIRTKKCTFVNFVSFDVLMLIVFVRICLRAVSYRILQFFVQTFLCLHPPSSSPPFVQRVSCFISLQYLIYDREILNVLSKWAFCDFLYHCRQYFSFFSF